MFIFDGSARVKNKGVAYSAILWKLPEWTIVAAISEFAENLTINEAEYRGLLLGLIYWLIRLKGGRSFVVTRTW